MSSTLESGQTIHHKPSHELPIVKNETQKKQTFKKDLKSEQEAFEKKQITIKTFKPSLVGDLEKDFSDEVTKMDKLGYELQTFTKREDGYGYLLVYKQKATAKALD